MCVRYLVVWRPPIVAKAARQRLVSNEVTSNPFLPCAVSGGHDGLAVNPFAVVLWDGWRAYLRNWGAPSCVSASGGTEEESVYDFLRVRVWLAGLLGSEVAVVGMSLSWKPVRRVDQRQRKNRKNCFGEDGKRGTFNWSYSSLAIRTP